jgi:YegS/Rv2252/BmrU family lipid kinase
MYHVIANGNVFKGKYASDIDIVKDVFKRAGKDCFIHFTQHAGHAKEIAAELTSSGEEITLIAMGGDGTLHEVLNGVNDTSKCYLGLIPFGTGNDFAEAAGIPGDTKAAAELIAFKCPSPIDYIELTNGLRSINAVGAGMDVDVLERTYAGKRTGRNKYMHAFIQSLIHFKSKNFTIIYNGKEEKHHGLIACLGNGKQIGGGIKLFPKAELSDGYMDLFIVDYLNKFKTLIAFIRLMMGKIDKIKEVTQAKVKEAKFIPEEENYTIQAEGELYNNVSLEAKVISGKLKFYLP